MNEYYCASQETHVHAHTHTHTHAPARLDAAQLHPEAYLVLDLVTNRENLAVIKETQTIVLLYTFK